MADKDKSREKPEYDAHGDKIKEKGKGYYVTDKSLVITELDWDNPWNQPNHAFPSKEAILRWENRRRHKAIFKAFESTLFEVGSRKVPVDQIRANIESSKHLKDFTDAEYYTTLVHVIFYAGFRASTVGKKLDVINQHFPNYESVARYSSKEVDAILRDTRMIRNRNKIHACVENAKTFRNIVREHGSFKRYIDSFGSADTDSNLMKLKVDLQTRMYGLGPVNVYHFLMIIGLNVIKPDRVLCRIFTRLKLVDRTDDYDGVVQQGRRFAEATGEPIRYVDLIFVKYGQMENKKYGLDRGICLENQPHCRDCAAQEYCLYFFESKLERPA